MGLMKIDTSKRNIEPGKPSSAGLFRLGLIPDWLDRIFHMSVTPIIAFFSASKITPNWITFSGFLLIVLAGYFLLDGKYYHAVGFIILGGIFDYIDGKVAAQTNQMTVFGAIFDSVLDRYSDMIIFLALAIYYHKNDYFLSTLVTIIALVGTFMTSYIKAVGKSHGLDFRAGFLRRQERMTVLSIVMVFSFLDPTLKNWLAPYTESFEIPSPNLVVVLGIWFLAVFSNITALQRLMKLKILSKEIDAGR
jgi:CDP-diacylglycerol--glycerol-3-phosphate 3-phosphatidyltransferase